MSKPWAISAQPCETCRRSPSNPSRSTIADLRGSLLRHSDVIQASLHPREVGPSAAFQTPERSASHRQLKRPPAELPRAIPARPARDQPVASGRPAASHRSQVRPRPRPAPAKPAARTTPARRHTVEPVADRSTAAATSQATRTRPTRVITGRTAVSSAPAAPPWRGSRATSVRVSHNPRYVMRRGELADRSHGGRCVQRQENDTGNDTNVSLETTPIVTLTADGHLVDIDHRLQLTASGTQLLKDIGVDVNTISAGRRPTVRKCLDWTERRHHLSGAAGAALLQLLLERRWAAPGRQPRSIRITQTGRTAIAAHLGYPDPAVPTREPAPA